MAAIKKWVIPMLLVGMVVMWDQRQTAIYRQRLQHLIDELDERGKRIPSRLREHEFNLIQFGGMGDGISLNTLAFERAVAAVHSAGSGQLNVPPGVWLTAPFNLTSNMTLFLANGAVILDEKENGFWSVLPPLPSYGRGRDLPGIRYGSLIHGEMLDNVIITGNNGTIDGQRRRWWELDYELRRLKRTRGALIELLWCNNVEISNINLVSWPLWALHVYDSTNVTIRNLTIPAPGKSAKYGRLGSSQAIDNTVALNMNLSF